MITYEKTKESETKSSYTNKVLLSNTDNIRCYFDVFYRASNVTFSDYTSFGT